VSSSLCDELAPKPKASAVTRAERVVGVALLAAAVVWWLAVPTYPNYDAYYHLVWGREFLDGLTPSFEAYAAPTQHPLYVGYAALVGLVGEDADRLLVLTTLLCLVVLAWGTWRLALALFGPWPALLATLFVGSSFAFLLYAVRAYVDVPFLALVVWAAVREVEGRKGAAGLLVLAGLLRPEAWILAGLLWLWRWPRADAATRARGAVLVALAPVIWAAVDLAVTGNPLHSVTATSSLAEDLGRERGIAKVPRLFVTQLADVARPPVALAGVIGAVLAVREFGWRRMAIPLALLAAGVIAFTGTGIAGLSILPRYLTVPAVALCVFAGYAVAGFTVLPAGHPWRRLWGAGAAGAVVLGAVFLVLKLGSFGTLADELRFGRGIHDDLRALLHSEQVQADLRCGPITFPNYRMVPDARWMLDLPRSDVGARSAKRRDRGVAVFTIGRDTLRRYGFADGASPLTNVPDPGFLPLVRVGRLSAYSAC
jgi:hypothetical protein